MFMAKYLDGLLEGDADSHGDDGLTAERGAWRLKNKFDH
jgi:hypothetical protein